MFKYVRYKQLREENPEISNCGKHWSQNETEQLRKELCEHLSTEEIAKNHKRTIGGIIARVKLINTITPETENQGKYWSHAETKQLREELIEHKSTNEIAKIHKRTIGGIMVRIKLINMLSL